MHTVEDVLEKIQFTRKNGLVLCKQVNKDNYIGERYHIQEKANELEATAVLFRRKYNDNDEIIASHPVLYIYERDDDFFNSPAHIKLHAKIWSAGDIDVYFIVSTTRIDIINARKPAEVQDRDRDLDVERLRLISDALEQFNDKRFSALVFGRGTFWEQEDFFDPQKRSFYNNQLKEENTPFHQLLEHLMAVRKYLYHKQPKLSPETIDKLLIICILVKFLEEIKDDDGKNTLRDIYTDHDIKNFAEALERGLCISVLEELGREFNGNIFDNFLPEEKQQIQQADLSLVASFLRAQLDPGTGQYFLWQQYSFDYLPVELISAIYERFLPKEKGVVYTPPFLVNFLIDEVMPLDKAEVYFSQNQFKVLDPSCGSGVFLVAAYKRILQWWSVNYSIANNESTFLKPDKQICQEILEKNIFGVDIKRTATLISVFSLTIALLDKLEPKEIWNDLKLSSLQNNIRSENFFEWVIVSSKERKEFDLVIGNPPFNRMATTTPEDVEVENEFLQQIDLNSKRIPNNDFALKFFEGAMFLGKRTCLILPSNILLYNKTNSAQKYRNRIFTEFTVEKIFDFTFLRESLFIKKSLRRAGQKRRTGRKPVCAILALSKKSQKQKIEHTVVKRLSSIENKIFFEIDHYDRHFVSHDWATDKEKQFVWKTNLLGGGRLFHLIYRLSLLPTLKDLIGSKNNWKEIRGFEGGKEIVAKCQDKIVGITESGKPEIERDVDIYSNDLKSLFMYEPPFMIIEQILGKDSLSACFIPVNNTFTQKSRLYYNRDYIGISVPNEDESTLEDLYTLIRTKKRSSQLNYQLFVLCISSNCLITHDTAIRKEDILSLPYSIENEDYLQLSEAERILQEDVLKYYVHSGKAISARGQGRRLHQKVSLKQLETFGEIFCDTLNPIYARNGKSWQCGTVYQTRLFTVYQFGYGKNQGLSSQVLDELDDLIESLIYNTSSQRGVIFTRVGRIYKHLNGYDCVFLIKPSAIRYWLNSIALRDADETFVDLKKAGC